MDRSSTGGVGRVFQGWAIVFVVALAGGLAPMARAQKDARITSRNVTAYADLLAFDADQMEIARLLHDEYMGEMETATNDRRDAMIELKTGTQGGKGDPEARERYFKATQTYEVRVARVEEAFFSDLQLMLDDEQAMRWPRVERLRRRETTLRSGWLSGEGIDLIALTNQVMGDHRVSTDVASALETYELQLDRALVTKARVMTDMLDAVSNPKRPLDQSDYAELGQTKQTMGLGVRDINRRHARLIEALLPEDLGAAFEKEWLRRSFPKIYRESRPDRLFRALGELGDLSIGQRESIDLQRASYTRERGAADKAWSAAIIEREDNADEGAGGKGQRPRDGDRLRPVERAQRSRQDLDERYERKVIALLTPAQQEALPTLEDPAVSKSSLKGKGE